MQNSPKVENKEIDTTPFEISESKNYQNLKIQHKSKTKEENMKQSHNQQKMKL